MTGLTVDGAMQLLTALKDLIDNNGWVIGVWSDSGMVKTLTPTTSIEDNTLKVSALDNSGDEYNFNKVTIQSQEGTIYIEYQDGDRTKDATKLLYIDIYISFETISG